MIVSKSLITSAISRQPDLDLLAKKVQQTTPLELESKDFWAKRVNVISRQQQESPFFALERLIGKSDLLPFNYFQKGIQVGNGVGRILLNDQTGLSGYATGFMVSPQLMLTNHHVLPEGGDMQLSQIQFNYEQDLDGNTNDTVTFNLSPDTFFYTDAAFDFSLIAVQTTDVTNVHQLSEFGYIVLNPELGKVATGEYLSIIQHPEGHEKQIAIRENQLIDHNDNDYLWYRTDTAPGSSGSPVFNDQWQLVALHHSGVPETDANGNYKKKDGTVYPKDVTNIDMDDIVWKANEGIRISRIVAQLQQNKPNDPLVKTILVNAAQAANRVPSPAVPMDIPNETKTIPSLKPNFQNQYVMANQNDNKYTVTIPLNITISLGGQQLAVSAGDKENQTEPSSLATFDTNEKAIVIDPDYSNREGFNENFLGQKVGLPVFPDASLNTVTKLTGSNDYVLKYNHFSIVMNKARKMAWFTGVNIDSVSYNKLKGQIPSRKEIGSDSWHFDPRIDQNDQIPASFYTGNDFDIGHQVRREDPVWGPTVEFAIKCNNDTFHLSNACPQHKEFNQGTAPADPGDTTKGKTLWQGLENYILDNAHNNGLKVNVYTGPVLQDSDKEFNNTGIHIPEAFWKVVVMQKNSGSLSATAYLVSQASLIKDMLEEFVFGQYRTYQVAVKHIEDLTGLNFNVSQFDPLDHLPLNAHEAAQLGQKNKIRPIYDYNDIIF